jgi:AraC-like DNA-binding protein
MVTDVRSTAQDIRRTPRLINEADNAYFQLFEAEHHTVSLYIKGLRLDRARRDLLDPRFAHRPICAIAYTCGFGDLSGFNRAFKNAYAVSPTDLRNASTSTAARHI